jgi:SAM-dependent methyltransferase
MTYDAIVRPFAPYQALLDEIVALIERSRSHADRGTLKVLDAACGTGTVGLRLAREGYAVVGVDTVGPLVDEARARAAAAGAAARFDRLDLLGEALPGAGTFDVVVSMHTVYWHPDPAGFLAACQRSLRPDGHAIFLTYARPAHVVATCRAVRAREGRGASLRALRWLVPTAAFELLRHYTPHYVSEAAFHRMLGDAGFAVLESRRTFLADLSLLAWAAKADAAPPSTAVKGE